MFSINDQGKEQAERIEKKSLIKQQLTADVAAGLFTGVFCAALFNPWDRALYLSVKNNKPFLTIENFKHPYHGFTQAMMQRAFLGSIYYILQGELKYHLYPYLREDLKISEGVTQFCIGSMAGSISGLSTNSISAIKYHTWGHNERTFFLSAREMWSGGQLKPFLKGTQATIGRDVIFGSTYEVTRHLMRKNVSKPNKFNEDYLDFICNASSAGFATIASAPLNYARTIQYAAPPNEITPTILRTLKDVWKESKQNNRSLFSRTSFFQQKFRMGWGTARVAVGMALGQQVFDEACANIKSLAKKTL